MRSVVKKLNFFHRNPSLKILSAPTQIKPYSTTTAALTQEEVSQINALIPRLCESDHLKEAVNLISVALSTANPPLASLPLSSLINRLASQPDLVHPMHLLNNLKFNPTASKPAILIPVLKMFLSSCFEKGQPKKAVKIFQWVARPDFPGSAAVNLDIYFGLVEGFCMNGMILESLRVLRVMLNRDLVIEDEIRLCVYRGLLMEARVREALELNAALGRCTPGSDRGTSALEEVMDLLDKMIANWVE